MANHEISADLIAGTIDSLTGDNLSTLDFDLLKQILIEARRNHIETTTLKDEATVLKEDYRGRIAGMLKAVAVAERSEAKQIETASRLTSLGDLTATELITEYRLAAARFRDAFPASFGRLSSFDKNIRAQQSYSDYK